MTNNGIQFFILTGQPGVGKTTLIKKLASLVNKEGVKTTGFYTEELRVNNTNRVGFDIVTLDGQRGRLARDFLEVPVKHKVGKYYVLIEEFERIALPSLKCEENMQQLLVIDEIGKMELLSDSFKTLIRDIFSDASKRVVLATIPVRKGDLIVERIRSHPKAKVWTVTKANRHTIHAEIVEHLKEIKSALDFK